MAGLKVRLPLQVSLQGVDATIFRVDTGQRYPAIAEQLLQHLLPGDDSVDQVSRGINHGHQAERLVIGLPVAGKNRLQRLLP